MNPPSNDPADGGIQVTISILDSNGNSVKRCKPRVTDLSTAHSIAEKLQKKFKGSDYIIY